MTTFRTGQAVRIPWGLAHSLPAHVIEVWGNPARQVRVALDDIDDENDGPTTLLLSPDVLIPSQTTGSAGAA